MVEVPAGMKLRPGKILHLKGSNDMGDSMGDMTHDMPSLNRQNYLSLTTSAPLLLGGGGFAFAASAGYGWNKGGFEFGPTLTLAYAAETFIFSGALGADINFTNNSHPNTFVPAFNLNASFTGGGAGTAIGFGGGLVGKFFVFKNSPSAIRLSIAYNGILSGGVLTNSIEFLGIGLQTYF